MVHALDAVDVDSMPDLERLAREVARDGRPRLLRADGVDLAVLVPASESESVVEADDDEYDVLEELERRRNLGMGYAEMTAGILKKYAKNPPPTPREEKEAFEQAVADQVVESMRNEWPRSRS